MCMDWRLWVLPLDEQGAVICLCLQEQDMP